jgi:hypothetical protein
MATLIKNSTLLFFFFAVGCNSNTDVQKQETKKNSIVSTPTDSSILVKRLDSLPQPKFPFSSVGGQYYKLDLTDFRDKQLFNISFKLIPRAVGGGYIDPEDGDSTFNLTNEQYIAEWCVLQRRSNFFVTAIRAGRVYLATINYHLKPIDAIRIDYTDPASNRHWNSSREATINQNLRTTLHHLYYVQTDEQGNMDIDSSGEYWMIDSLGKFYKNNSR